MTRLRRSRGFTLIETMMVVAIMGVLGSVAASELTQLRLRARAAERRTILVAISRAVTDVVSSKGSVPGGTFLGDWNPSGAPTTTKRVFANAQAGWRDLALELEGRTFYSYKFLCDDHGGASAATLDTWAVGDLDGDGLQSTKIISYVAIDNVFQLASEVPAEGSEDQFTF
jgi:prepilin-type N-terminal cleavage/methylation domain-containing protein